MRRGRVPRGGGGGGFGGGGFSGGGHVGGGGGRAGPVGGGGGFRGRVELASVERASPVDARRSLRRQNWHVRSATAGLFETRPR